MLMFRFVLGAIVTRRAAGGVGLGDRDVAHMGLAFHLFSSLSLARPAYSWRFGSRVQPPPGEVARLVLGGGIGHPIARGDEQLARLNPALAVFAAKLGADGHAAALVQDSYWRQRHRNGEQVRAGGSGGGAGRG
jgi:hypothetical protein